MFSRFKRNKKLAIVILFYAKMIIFKASNLNNAQNMIYLSKINHKGEIRIQLQFDRNYDFINKIKSIHGRRWSQTKKCWHLPYSSESLENLKLKFGEENLVFPDTKQVPLKKLQVQFISYHTGNDTRKKVIGEKIIVELKNKNWIEVYVPSQKKGWIGILKNINGRKWNQQKICWELPNVKQSYKQLKNLIGLSYIKFNFRINKNIPDYYQPIKSDQLVIRKKVNKGIDHLNNIQKTEIQKLEDQLTLKQFSYSTIKNYRHHLIAIFLYYNQKEPQKINSDDIQKYILHQIRFKKIAESTQNSIINSIKSYWERVLGLPKEIIKIPRPKKTKHLPNVFSQAEVIKLIESPKNLKHRLILLLIYSAGLRLSELINIRVRDISISRRVIFIKDSKGKKDRFVTLAEQILPYLKEYQNQYNPNYWLFEGKSGGQYSKRSVQSIFYKALESSKVFAYGTVHTLRHSYATHCIENGFSTALLKEALGHSSIKTTEKYLHISSHALKTLKSPLDIIKHKQSS